jgi:hypothetical protein
MAGLPGIVLRIGANTKDAIDGINKVEGRLSKFKGVALGVGAAAAAGAAAVVGMAVAIGTDAVKAAIEEEQSVGKLTTTLKNLGLAHQDTKVEQFIDDMQFATGIADNEMRPAYDRLIRSTGDVEEANKALAIALDIAVAKGRNVQEVADVLGKAYDGNTMALGRMGVALDRSVLKSGDMGKITQALIDKFGGQASAAANTLGGAIQGVQIGWDELVESFGQGLVGSTTEDIEKLKQIQQQLRDMQPEAQRAGEDVRNLGVGALTTWDRISALSDALDRQDWSQAWDFLTSGDDDAAWQRKINAYYAQLDALDRKNRETSSSSQTLGQELAGEATAAERAAWASQAAADGVDKIDVGAEKSISSLQRLQGALEGIFSTAGSFGKAQEKFAQGIAWTQLLAQGPGKSGSKTTKVPTGKQTAVNAYIDPETGDLVAAHMKPVYENQTTQFSTKADYLAYANQLVSQAVATAKTLGPKAANKLLQNAQDRVTQLLKQAGYQDARAQAAALIGPVNINPHPRPWEQLYRDGADGQGVGSVDPTRYTRRAQNADSRAAARSARSRARP